MILKKEFDECSTEFNHVAIDRFIKKAYNFNNNTITKKHKYWSITTKDVQLVLKALKNSINLSKEYWNYSSFVIEYI